MATELLARLALCNEVLADPGSPSSVAAATESFAIQCAIASSLGYRALEVAPFTLAPDPLQLTEHDLANYRRIATDSGLAICGLHWLLVAPPGLHLGTPDTSVRQRTTEALIRLTEHAATLGADYVVHGSPRQREPLGGYDPVHARIGAWYALSSVAVRAGELDINYCIEPLARSETSFLNTVAEAVAFAQQVDHPAFATMLDCSAAARSEAESVDATLARWLPTGWVRHVQLNDPNRRAPGQGALDFEPILRTLHEHGYAGWLAVEPFIYDPDPVGCARAAIEYLRRVAAAVVQPSADVMRRAR